MNQGTRAPRGLLSMTVAVLLVSGCEWEVDAGAGSQGLENHSADAGCENDTPREGDPICGALFPAQIMGECNDCEDRGCTQPNEGWFQCVCHREGEYCYQQHLVPDAVGDLCVYQGESCECNDGLGRIYDCSCTGGADECVCMVPRPDPPVLDYEFDCEMTNRD